MQHAARHRYDIADGNHRIAYGMHNDAGTCAGAQGYGYGGRWYGVYENAKALRKRRPTYGTAAPAQQARSDAHKKRWAP